MKLKILCMYYHNTALRAQAGLTNGQALSHAPVMAWKRSALYSRQLQPSQSQGPSQRARHSSSATKYSCSAVSRWGMASCGCSSEQSRTPSRNSSYWEEGVLKRRPWTTLSSLLPTTFTRVLISCLSQVMNGRGGCDIMKALC